MCVKCGYSPVQIESAQTARMLKNLDGSGIARIDLDRPGHTVAKNAIDAEQAAQLELIGQHLTEALKRGPRCRVQWPRPDAAAIAKRPRA